ncbi:CopG family ribbon-helix-helix protein [Paludisphaera mucosa]|uniref:Ribbon-helix-helix protein, CopG family n=1 Tax=Paludisphaera mucosa TaxID=3030827 RepID=A0ABT6FJ10_9BACT|nr:ribbon-helix-helix protein, CopG family [Paludisphaera mucosa]
MKKHHTNIRVDSDILERLDSDAAALERSRAYLINKIIREHYERIGGAPPAPGSKPAQTPAKRRK